MNPGIRELNKKVKNKQETESKLVGRFWSLSKEIVLPHFEVYKQKKEELKISEENIKSELSKVARESEFELSEIRKNQERVINLKTAMDNINGNLRLMGIESFYIGEDDEDPLLYKIYRVQGEGGVYKTLSEGEKTLITFLYFLEICKGSADRQQLFSPSRKVVVVDDPISSLSHNHIYDLAYLIRKSIIGGGFYKVLIFTHSLFFFHELLQLKFKAKYDLFRVHRSDVSKVKPINSEEIKNEYQAYWKIIEDYSASGVAEISLPNAMRSILEYYFGFIHKNDDLRKALDELGNEGEFKALFRYINRESHFDSININDHAEIDGERFVEQFRKIFEKTGHIDHYNKMMGVE